MGSGSRRDEPSAAKRQEAVLVARLLGWRKHDGTTSGTTGRITLIGVPRV